MGGVPSKPGDAATQLQVIGGGYSRTGTASMQLALENLLQGPVMHEVTYVLWREDSFTKNWVRLYEAREAGDKEKTMKLLRELTAGFVGVTDTPNFDFVPELIELYPEAKVVLVTRDPERWWTSIGGNLRYEFRDLIEVHNEMVKRVVPPDRLLVMNPGEGWQPLCKFLDRPVPNQPFPRLRNAEEAERVAMGIFGKCILLWLGIIGVAAVTVHTATSFVKTQHLGIIRSSIEQ